VRFIDFRKQATICIYRLKITLAGLIVPLFTSKLA